MCLPFSTGLSDKSYFTPPFQVDYANQVEVGNGVFANHDLTLMSAVGIILEDGVMIGPHVTLLTVNHDLKDLQIIKCKPVTIKKRHGLERMLRFCRELQLGKVLLLEVPV